MFFYVYQKKNMIIKYEIKENYLFFPLLRFDFLQIELTEMKSVHIYLNINMKYVTFLFVLI